MSETEQNCLLEASRGLLVLSLTESCRVSQPLPTVETQQALTCGHAATSLGCRLRRCSSA